MANDRQSPYRVIRHRRFLSTRRFIEWYQYPLLKLHREFPFDVLHCHSVHPCGYLGALCRNRLKAALVLTSHGGDIREGGARIRKPGARSRAIMALREADAVVSISRFTTQALMSLEPATKIVEIQNGVDLASFENQGRRRHNSTHEFERASTCCFLGDSIRAKDSTFCWKPGPRARRKLIRAGCWQ